MNREIDQLFINCYNIFDGNSKDLLHYYSFCGFSSLANVKVFWILMCAVAFSEVVKNPVGIQEITIFGINYQ